MGGGRSGASPNHGGTVSSFAPGRAEPDSRECQRVKRLALILIVVAALAGASVAAAGGIADEPCPNIRGEHTNTCPSGTVGAPYSIRFVESDGSGLRERQAEVQLDSGLLPPGLTLRRRLIEGHWDAGGGFQFYVESASLGRQESLCGEANAEAVPRS